MWIRCHLGMLGLFTLATFSPANRATAEKPVVHDRALEIVEYASEPLVVTPTGIAVARDGRVFVLESHTHFRPEDYDGPPGDRVLVLHDRDGDGRADSKTVFHEGLRYGMDLAFHPDGTLYLASRWAIYRLPDANRDNRADRLERIIFLQTPGDYPHNGLSGLAFDPAGRLYFGLGENLGEPYVLQGSDGRSFSGGGEGGSTYRCDALGRNLQRTSTGWWNPFGLAVDSFGRVFGTDNDPGSSPPCRLIDVFETGNYGYEYRYGRTGLNPLVTWTGDLPGTLPMVSGTGEAPCGIVAYEGGSFPKQYDGALIVGVWADHAIEWYPRHDDPGFGLARVDRRILVRGDNDFRPVDVAVAPDGSLYFTDWVLASYALHGRGRVWHVKVRSSRKSPAEDVAESDALLSRSRDIRERVAKEMAQTPGGREKLWKVVRGADHPAARATALWTLVGLEPSQRPTNWVAVLTALAEGDAPVSLRVLAAGTLGSDWKPLKPRRLPHRLFALWLRDHAREVDRETLAAGLASDDPLLRHAAIEALADPCVGRRWGEALARDHLWAVVLAARRGWRLSPDARRRWITRALRSHDAAARLVAIKWIADERLRELKPELETLWYSDDLDYRAFRAHWVCRQRLQGEEVTDWPSPADLKKLLANDQISPATRRWAWEVAVRRGVALPIDQLTTQIRSGTSALAAVWALAEHPLPERRKALRQVAADEKLPVAVRCVAVMGLADFAESEVAFLIGLLDSPHRAIVAEALRALPGVELDADTHRVLKRTAKRWPDLEESVQRALTGKLGSRPPADDVEAWLALVGEESGNIEAGERLFFHPKIATCGKCHAVLGRGKQVGPSMSAMSARLRALGTQRRRWLLKQMLQPSAEMAPQYTPWLIRTTDGQIHTGLPLRKGGGAEAYLGSDGIEFVLKKSEIEEHRESRTSLMPEGLLATMTIGELRDLIAYLESAAKSDKPHESSHR